MSAPTIVQLLNILMSGLILWNIIDIKNLRKRTEALENKNK